MPRKLLHLNDAGNIQELKEYIEDHVKLSNSRLFQDMTCTVALSGQESHLRPGVDKETFDLETHAQKIAGATNLCGEVAEHPCESCLSKNGPFIDCITLHGYEGVTKRCCSNCQWTLLTTDRTNHCSFAEGRKI